MDILQHQVIPTDDDLLANYLDDASASSSSQTVTGKSDVFSDDIEDATR
ncbi:hypothetical protein [Salinivibrio sp. ES.052]|nr:hypothetical protein [Salinivibrio sp. ES.052]